MSSQRETLIVVLALGVALSLYVVSFRDLMAAAAPATGTSSFEQSRGAVESFFQAAPAQAV